MRASPLTLTGRSRRQLLWLQERTAIGTSFGGTATQNSMTPIHIHVRIRVLQGRIARVDKVIYDNHQAQKGSRYRSSMSTWWAHWVRRSRSKQDPGEGPFAYG